MNNTDEQTATILAHYGLAANGNVWQVEDQVFIHHRALERIAAQAKITFDPPTVLRAERDEAALLVVGRMGDRAEWSIGEALVDVNYHVPGSEPAFVYAMAEKRAKDRVILKLVELHGVVSSAEPHAVESSPAYSNENTPAEPSSEPGIVGELKRTLDGAETVDAVVALMRDSETQRALGRLRPTGRMRCADMRRPAWSHSGGPRNELHRALLRLCTIPELRGVRHDQAPRLSFVGTPHLFEGLFRRA